ncbi:hypothetical protein HDZ31DRAFT_67964 [Schizophyllum fasciatum]
MALQIQDLPIELMIRIMLYLDPQSVNLVARAHPQFAAVANTPIVLKHCAMITTGMRDTTGSNVPIHEVLEELKAYEEAWRNYRPVCSITRNVPRDTVGLYELSGGHMFLGASGRQALYYLPLPTPKERAQQWSIMVIDDNIVDFALALYEHNLVVAITSRSEDSGPQSKDILEIRLLDFPSGRPHPLAKQDRIFLCKTHAHRRHPLLGIEVVGDTMVIATHYSRFDGDYLPSTFTFWDWKEGKKKMSFDGPPFGYTTFIFLTEDLLLVPNATNGTFEYWRISTTDPKRPAPVAVLRLPSLRPGVEILDLACRAEPNPHADVPRTFTDSPTGNNNPGLDGPSFHPAAEDAICVFQVHLLRPLNDDDLDESDSEEDEEGLPRSSHLFLVVHRSAFVDIFERIMGEGGDGAAHPGVDEPAEPSDQATADPTTSNPPSLSWSDWGPPVSRWLDYARINYNWITTSCGQRMVATLAPHLQIPTGNGFVDLYDFNPYTVKQTQAEIRRQRAEARKRRREELRQALELYLRKTAVGEAEDSDAARVLDTADVDTLLSRGPLEPLRSDFQEIPACPTPPEDEDSADLREGVVNTEKRPGTYVFDKPDSMRTLFEGALESRLPYVRTSSPRSTYYSGVMLDHRRIIGMAHNSRRGVEVHCFQ